MSIFHLLLGRGIWILELSRYQSHTKKHYAYHLRYIPRFHRGHLRSQQVVEGQRKECYLGLERKVPQELHMQKKPSKTRINPDL